MDGRAKLTPPLKRWRALNKSRQAREEARMYIAEGEHMTQEALKEKKACALVLDGAFAQRFAALLSEAARQSIPIYELSAASFSPLCDAKTPQGVLAVCGLTKAEASACAPLVVALEDVQDPGNVGTVIRTLDALGNCALIYTRGCADPYSPKALRASMGGVFRVPMIYADSLCARLEQMKGEGYRVLAGALDGAPFFLRGSDGARVCILIGNEGAGLSKQALEAATDRVRLPMAGGAESLNAAVACAIMAYDVRRRADGTPVA